MKNESEKQAKNIDSSTEKLLLSDVSGSFPSTKECHCMATAHQYRKRVFINQMNQEVTRIFYRCENCLSRIHSDFIPSLDDKNVNVLDLLKNYR
jgi:hypothetical protein